MKTILRTFISLGFLAGLFFLMRGNIPEILDTRLLDEIITVSSDEAIAMCRHVPSMAERYLSLPAFKDLE